MSDTRTIYLKNNEGTIYSSDPSNVGSEYLDMSGFDSLNPSENSIFTSATNISLMYSSYDVKLVLTFMSDYDNGRQARAQWIAKNQNSINQISVANTNNQDLIFSKQAKIKTIDFVENHYVNGVQAELTLELAGRWQSSVQRTSATVYPYTGGTKKYTYQYNYKYGYQIITDEVKTDGYNGFIINIPSQTTPVNVTLTAPNGLSATLTTSQTNVPLQISSDMIGYSLDNFDTFTLLNKGFPASKYWDNLLSVYSTIQTILNANTVTVSVASGTGTSIPFEFYLYKLQDLI
ncbi:putative structural protein [Leuconostoc phage phiLN6B]|uniref:Putative structural protein n=1 Tax=Leuconostoc phage phiLN6B TaxID=1262520 RepID=A0A059PAF6_9CAUD|nr:baseplate protein [Leuconostoc phage phiLN6B]AFY98310.1 putative structural protein [Leuconostoc phage phiLN6B]